MKTISISRLKNKYIILLLCALITSPLFSAGEVDTVKKPGMVKSAELSDKLDNLVEAYKTNSGTSGIAVLVAKQGSIIYKKYFGLANIENNIEVKDVTEFPIGSLTKQFTGFSILQLVMSGKLSLDDKLEKFYPDFPDADKISVRNLLNHTSGILNYMHNKKFNEQVRGAKQNSEQMISWFQSKPSLFEPGTRWNYTNSGTYLLGLIIEKVTSMSYADYLKENVFIPFNMNDSYVAGSTEIIPNRAAGYSLTKDGYVNAPTYDVSIPFSAGAIISTVDDLWKFINTVHRSNIVSADLRKFIYKQEILPNGEDAVYTLGCLFSSTFEGYKVYSHPGSIYGYTSHEAYYPEEDLFIVILTNGDQGPASLTQKISREILGVSQPEYVTEEITQKEISRLAGNYYFASQSFVDYENAVVVFNNGMLLFSMGNSMEEMFTMPFNSVGNGLFVMLEDNELTLKVDSNLELPIIELSYNSVKFKLEKLPD